MLMEMIGVGLVMLLAGFVIWRRGDRPEKQLRQAHQMVATLSQKQQLDKDKVAIMFDQLYGIIKKALETGQEPLLYKAIDMLKLAFGTIVDSKDEPSRLMTVIVAAIHTKRSDAAGHLLDCFRPLFRRGELDDVPELLDCTLTIAGAAMKNKANFLAAKIIENIFVALERSDRQDHKIAIDASFRALQKLGSLAIRHHDEALFREVATCFAHWSSASRTTIEQLGASHCLSAWLYQIIKRNDPTVLPVLDQLAETLNRNGLIKRQVLQEFVSSWTQLAGTACMNPNSKVAPIVIQRLLSLSLNTNDIVFLRHALQGLGHISSMALTRYGFDGAFQIVLPLAEAGRRLLHAEIIFGPSESSEFRPLAIHVLVKELLTVFEHLARQQMVISTGEVIGQFHDIWHYHTDLTESYGKSARTFCQLLLSFWMQNHKAKARRIELSESAKKELSGFSEADRDRLQFILQ